MVPYILMLGIPGIAAFALVITQNKYLLKRTIVIDLFFSIFLMILMFRSIATGADLTNYSNMFVKYYTLSWSEIISGIFTGSFEAGYVILSKLLSYFTKDFQWMIVITSLISILPIWVLYRKNGYHPFLMAILFVNIAPFSMYFSGLRQSMAMAMSIPCYYNCKEKQLKNFLFCVCCAYFVHRSAIILLLMYPVYHAKIKDGLHLLYLIPALAILYIFNMPIFRFLMLFMEEKYYERYFSSIGYTGAYAILLVLLAFLIYSFTIVDKKKLDGEIIGLRNILVLCVAIQIFAGVHTIAMRMNYYYLVFVPILMTQIPNLCDNKNRQIALLSILCIGIFFFGYFYYNLYTGTDLLNIYPYQGCWQLR